MEVQVLLSAPPKTHRKMRFLLFNCFPPFS